MMSIGLHLDVTLFFTFFISMKEMMVVKKYTKSIKREFFEKWNSLGYLEEDMVKAVNEITSRINQGGKILVCGNGGSASDSEHIVGELLKDL